MSAIAQNLPVNSIPAAHPAAEKSTALPWLSFVVALAACCIPLGAQWDISWHQSIGRDSFWTPAHMMIYLGGALPGILCGWVVLRRTFFASTDDHEPAVQLWGFRGPLGGWLTIWGSLAMLVSAPFDNWWHDAYGLDVQILSPPHTLLALGMTGVAVGAMVLAASVRNRANDTQRPMANAIFLFSCGTLVTMGMIFVMEYSFPNDQHTGLYYQVICLLLPLYPVIAVRTTRMPLAATIVGSIYVLMVLLMVWVLPLFGAQPKLAPVWNPITHMVPPPWPVLAFVPALGVDLAHRFLGRERGFLRDSLLALVMGALFFGLLLLVQWNFSTFLLSPASRNAFFVGDAVWSYGAGPGQWRHDLWHLQERPFTVMTVWSGILIAAVVCRVALWLGNWLGTVKR